MDAVVSFPKSGRTWLRVMLDQYGLPLEWTHADSGHSHGLPISKIDTTEARKYQRILFLHRDPRDTVVSGYYQKVFRRDGYAGTMSDFIRDPNHGLEKVLRFNHMWITLAQTRPNIMVATYEELKADTEGTLAQIIQFFGQPVDRARVTEIVEESRFERMQARERQGEYTSTYGKILTPAEPSEPDSFKVRKGKVGGYREELTPEDVAFCDKTVEDFLLQVSKMARAESKPRRLAVFHLGLPKTGSTTIQDMLAMNQETLAAWGVNVSARDHVSRPLRHAAVNLTQRGGLAAMLRYKLALWRFGRRMRAQTGDCILVSDENIIGTESAHLFRDLGKLDFGKFALRMERALGPDWDCRYVVYVRARDRWRASSYNQTLKKVKHTQTYEDWCRVNNDLSGPDRIIAQLQAALGARLQVVEMEAELASGNALGAAVLAACGLEAGQVSQLKPPRQRNASLPPAAIEFIRTLAAHGINEQTQRKIATLVKDNAHLFALDKSGSQRDATQPLDPEE